jgi:hemoglobin-like flavoprotein
VSPESEQLVRETWARLSPASDTLVATFYSRLFEANPEARALFAATNMSEQRLKFASMLDEIIRALDEPDMLVNDVAASGRRHVGYGVIDRDYEDVGAALLYAIRMSLGTAFTRKVEAAWREAYTLVSEVMRRAAAKSAGPDSQHE